jgi:hypothetical protein
MFCANIFHHNTSFDPKISPTINMALTIDLPLGIENHGLFFRFIAYTKSKMDLKKNHVAN